MSVLELWGYHYVAYCDWFIHAPSRRIYSWPTHKSRVIW
jgi:hypothetical protein